MVIAPSSIPEQFWTVAYDGRRIPSDDAIPDLSLGANCQLFAYALLAHFGHPMLSFRSSELWSDTERTRAVPPPHAALDLLLFNASSDVWGAHVAVSLGDNHAIHLSQRIGRPAVWSLNRFAAEADYRVLVGAKRLA